MLGFCGPAIDSAPTAHWKNVLQIKMSTGVMLNFIGITAVLVDELGKERSHAVQDNPISLAQRAPNRETRSLRCIDAQEKPPRRHETGGGIEVQSCEMLDQTGIDMTG